MPKGHLLIDLTGRTFGYWVVIRRDGSDKHRCPLWLCRCNCGKIKSVNGISLREGRSVSCGCYKIEKQTTALGECYKTTEYVVWNGMKGRCYNSNNKDYKNYGGRGIKVCDRWLGKNGYKNFLEDMGRRPSLKHTINRKDNDGNYYKQNCNWATDYQQRRNRRDSNWQELNGRRMISVDWAKMFNISVQSFVAFLKSHTMTEAYEYYIGKKYAKLKNNFFFVMSIN